MVTVVDLYMFVMPPAIAKYHTSVHRRQTKLLIWSYSFIWTKHRTWRTDWPSYRGWKWHLFI